MDAVRFQGICCQRAELIGKRSLDQLSSLPGAANRGGHLYAAFLPVNMKPRLACLFRGFLAPAHGEMCIRLCERAVLNQQFSFWHFEALDGFWTAERADAIAAI